MSSMNELVGMCVGLMIIVIVAQIGPGMGDQVSQAMPVSDASAFANATTGAEVWTSGFNIVSIVVLILFIAVAIRSLKGIQGNGGQD